MEANNTQKNDTGTSQVKMEPAKRIGKGTIVKQDQNAKRSKVKTTGTTSIEELNERKIGKIFEGDVLVVYKYILDKVNKTREVVRADVTDIKAEMTVTVNVKDDLVQQFEDKLIIGMGIRISDFQLEEKSDFDRGDCDYIIVLQETSSIETIPRICNEYKFIPSNTICQLLNNPNDYPVGTVGALVLGTKKMGSLITFELKDGHGEEDTAQLELHPSLAHHHALVDEMLRRNETPALLFRNIVTRRDKKNTFRTGTSTYICTLKDSRTLQVLNELSQQTFQVTGILRVINPFSNPFAAFCSQCNYKFDGFGILQEETGHCINCNKNVNYIQKMHLKMVLAIEKKQNINCSVDQSIIKELVPEIADAKYEDYIENKSKFVFSLREISIKGNFTLTHNNVVTNISFLTDHEEI